MTWIVYISVGLTALLFGAIILGFVAATIYDVWYRRRYKTFIELQQDHNKPHRPACK
jgi:hypothetical protein